jgi:translation initiation factor 3 subunit J
MWLGYALDLERLDTASPDVPPNLLTPGDSLKAAVSANPKTKADFTELSANIVAALVKKHEANGLFPAFVEQLAKDLCESLNAVQTRKVSSALSVLGNTKQQEERDKASGKKKVSATVPTRGAWRRERGEGTEALAASRLPAIPHPPPISSDHADMQGSAKPKLGATKVINKVDLDAYDDVLDDDDFM